MKNVKENPNKFRPSNAHYTEKAIDWVYKLCYFLIESIDNEDHDTAYEDLARMIKAAKRMRAIYEKGGL